MRQVISEQSALAVYRLSMEDAAAENLAFDEMATLIVEGDDPAALKRLKVFLGPRILQLRKQQRKTVDREQGENESEDREATRTRGIARA
jgi:hypothetical protein